MATALKNLSDHDASKIPSSEGMRFGIVVAEWNEHITGKLLEGAYNTLVKYGTQESDIHVKYVPGTVELTKAGDWFGMSDAVDAVILIGVVIQGDTPHFDYVCSSVTQGTTTLNLDHNIPFIFGVLTTNTEEQALDRAGGKHGNKGDEAAVTAIKMVDLHMQMQADFGIDD